MGNQIAKIVWWPIVCAIFYLSWVVFFYVWKKCSDRKWLIWGVIYLILFVAFLALYEKYPNEMWLKISLIIYWICGLVHSRLAWKEYELSK